jgi:tRNA dimethylallyltransferase
MGIRSKIILIYGPTASGKSKFAVQLAKKINGEIINADSMQVYNEFKILTARLKLKDQKNITHHLYGFHSVKKKFSSGVWLKLANKKINQIKKRKKVPILVGGTGLYFKALTNGLVKIPNISLKDRNKIRNLHKKLGQKKFYMKLIEVDPLTKNMIDLNDTQRSIRAYEVKTFTKKSLFDWYKKTKSIFEKEDFFKIYIDFPRPKLIERINQRTDLMLEEEAIKEVKNFVKLKIKKDNSSNKIIGVHEISQLLKNKLDLREVKELISIKTRQYAKRQSTWARGQMPDWIKLDPKNLNKFLKNI